MKKIRKKKSREKFPKIPRVNSAPLLSLASPARSAAVPGRTSPVPASAPSDASCLQISAPSDLICPSKKHEQYPMSNRVNSTSLHVWASPAGFPPDSGEPPLDPYSPLPIAHSPLISAQMEHIWPSNDAHKVPSYSPPAMEKDSLPSTEPSAAPIGDLLPPFISDLSALQDPQGPVTSPVAPSTHFTFSSTVDPVHPQQTELPASIPAASGIFGLSPTPFWNPQEEAIQSPMVSSQAPFTSGRNCTSSLAAHPRLGFGIQFPNYFQMATPMINSLNSNGPQGMGFRPMYSISGNSSEIGNPNFPISGQFPATILVNSGGFPAGFGPSLRGSEVPQSSSIFGNYMIGNSDPSPGASRPVNSGSEPVHLQRVDPVSSVIPGSVSDAGQVPISSVHSGKQTDPIPIKIGKFSVSFKNTLVPPSPGDLKQSFSHLDPVVAIPDPSLLDGRLGIKFSDDYIAELVEPLKFALVGKVVGARNLVSKSVVSQAFGQFGFVAPYQLKFLLRGHLVITLSCQDDYARLWTTEMMIGGGVSIRFTKWTPEFQISEDAPIAPVWIRIPDLPLHLYSKQSLFALAKILGNPIMMDEPTAYASNGAFARICVEIDKNQTINF